MSVSCQRSTVCRSGPGPARELAVAHSAAVAAGQLIRDRFSQVGGIWRNGRHDVKADVDILAEQIIVDRLRDAFPRDAIVAEEGGVHSPDAAGPNRRRVRTWLVDPLDGTVNYASGIPFFAVSLALLVDGQPVLGVVHDPVRGETHLAMEGAGSWLLPASTGVRVGDVPETVGTTTRRLRIRPLARLGDAVAAIDPGDPDEALPADTAGLARLRLRIRVERTLGSAALSLAWVGAGRLDGFIRPDGIQPLDVMAGALVAAEAGATVGEPHGGSWPDLARHGALLGIVAAHPRLHRAVLRALG